MSSALGEEWPFAVGASPFHVKGTAMKTAWTLAADRLGEAPLFGAMEPEVAAYLRQPFISSSWYDLRALVEISKAHARVTGERYADVVRWSTRGSARKDLRGIYRVFVRVTSAQTLATRLPKITTAFFDYGSVEVLEKSSEHARVVRRGTPAAFADWYEIVGGEWTCEALRIAGAADARYTATASSGGQDRGVPVVDLDFTVRWR